MCNFLTAPVLKWFIYLSCIIVLGIGSVLVWVGFLVQSSSFVQVLEYSYAGFIIIACGGILIFVAFIGIIGAWKLRRFFLTIFIISSLIIGVLLVSFGGVLIYLRNVSADYLSSTGSCRKHFQDADDASMKAASVFCTLYCPCNLDTSTAAKLGVQNPYKGSSVSAITCNPCESIQTYDPSVQQHLITWVNNTLGYTVNATDCAVTITQYNDAFYTSKYENFFVFTTWIEQQFSCSGLCTQHPLYYFSDVTVGTPKQACYSSLNGWAQNDFLVDGIISIALGLYQISIIYFAFTLCLCPKRKLDLPPEVLNSPGKAFKE
jgi:hypothetical protein